METFSLLLQDLHNCFYEKARYSEDYLNLSFDEKRTLCLKERKNLIFHLNSDQMLFENILQERLRWMKKPLFNSSTEPLYPASEWKTIRGDL